MHMHGSLQVPWHGAVGCRCYAGRLVVHPYDFMHMNIHGNHACTHIPWLLSCMGSLGHTSFFCVRVCNNWLIFGKQKRGSYTCMLHAYIMLNDHAI